VTQRIKSPKAAQELWFRTRDGLRIAANFYPGKKGFKTLIILSPGFAKYKDAPPMGELCEELTRYGDALCLDFRGTGHSEGRYGFGAMEHLDLEAVLKWGRRYRRRVLVGLSMGSYISLRAAHDHPGLVDKLLLVSVPTCFEDVLKTLGPIRQGWAIATDWKAIKNRLGSVHSIFFRWDNPFRPKPDASELAVRLKTPTYFLVGGKDRLVVKSLSRRIYEKASTPKDWTEIPEGNHAEFLYMEQPVEFRKWYQRHLP
jgi:pimeloyl-ACP methyl ester carboxylesterase